MLKKLAPAVAITASLFTSSVMAHGNLAQQANNAVTAALELLQKSQSKENLRAFKAVQAEIIAHEEFSVVVNYRDGQEFHFLCVEDESTEPETWGCVAK